MAGSIHDQIYNFLNLKRFQMLECDGRIPYNIVYAYEIGTRPIYDRTSIEFDVHVIARLIHSESSKFKISVFEDDLR